MIAMAPLLSLTQRSEHAGWGVFACRTGQDQEGPFYKADAPFRKIIEASGTPLRIEGIVFKGSDCSTTIANAVIDIWHCNDEGEYDMKGFNCRAQTKTDANGRYDFLTILPPSYGSRPRHIHFKIRAQGFQELTTQLYFKGDPHITNDFARNAEQDRIISLKKETKYQKGLFNIYL